MGTVLSEHLPPLLPDETAAQVMEGNAETLADFNHAIPSAAHARTNTQGSVGAFRNGAFVSSLFPKACVPCSHESANSPLHSQRGQEDAVWPDKLSHHGNVV